MKNYTLLIVVVFLCFTACKKEDKNANLFYSETLLSEVYSGNQAVHGLTYNSSYLIYESMEPYTYKKYTYDNQNALVKVETAYSFDPLSCAAPLGISQEADPRKAKISQYSEFDYDDALRLIRKANYFIKGGNPELTSYQTFDYENNKIIRLSSFNPQGGLTGYHDYKYDDNGNITKDDQYTNNSGIKLVNSTTCEYDNKNNPYQVLAGEGSPGKFTNRNNIIKQTFVSYNGTAESRNITLNVYEYNSLDYPVKINDLVCKYGK